jgi:glyoxylase-like metal-dependent hydrolase (beta-lactamase superfamily II)
METPTFRTDFEPAHGIAVEIAPGVRRLTANNPGPFTFHGTNSYIVGWDRVAVIDPGPDDDAHFEAMLAAIGGRDVSHILVTHTHVDHSPLAARLKGVTGAKVLAEGPHRPARKLYLGEVNPLDASGDQAFVPDGALVHGEMVEGDGFALEAVFTPGHTANHMAFALAGTGMLFSGDHVMAWATSIVAPPDGAMSDYMASLDLLLSRPETLYFPGHGGPVVKAHEFVRALRTHRRMREAAILARIRAGELTIPVIVASIYRDTDPKLHGAAALSVLAHIEDLVASGRVECDGPPSLAARYRAGKEA